MDRGSRMHVLDWVGQTAFTRSLTDMVAVTGMTVPERAKRMPQGGLEREEARLGKDCGGLIPDDLNLEPQDWGPASSVRANVPNSELACAARASDGRDGLILVEAKAHVGEFTREAKGKPPGNPANHARISKAIEDARLALSSDLPGFDIAVDRWYQLANRLAFSWKLAASGMPTTLIYLGFVGDADVGDPIRDWQHWKEILAMASAVVPISTWGTRIDCGAAPLWILACARRGAKQTPALAQGTSTMEPASASLVNA